MRFERPWKVLEGPERPCGEAFLRLSGTEIRSQSGPRSSRTPLGGHLAKPASHLMKEELEV